MSDNPQRSLSEIQQEYASLCSRAGHIQYQIFVQTEDLSMLNKTLKDLNLEGAAAQARAAAEASKPAPLEAVPSEGESK